MRRSACGLAVLTAFAVLLGLGCGARTSLRTKGEEAQRKLDKLDILLSVDDSISMTDKQRLLKAAIPDLIGRLANPFCVDTERRAFPELTPAAGEPCPKGPGGQPLEREFLPVSDVHVGLVTSTLGDGGAVRADNDNNDLAHLFGSLSAGAGLSGMTAEGFLAWDPGKVQNQFESEVATMMGEVGESGSGFEAPLEAWYRFLVDPEPYAELALTFCSPEDITAECVVEARGLDTALLEQRRAFLRPDSVLVIIVLSDEDDCSARIEAKGWQFFQARVPLEKGTAACNTDPNDPCCLPCATPPPAGCVSDPECALDPISRDDGNLRCFEQQRRFGREILQPIERYHTALTQKSLCLDRPDLIDSDSCLRRATNPLFIDLEQGGPAARTPEAVFLTLIVGVPWQDLVTDPESLLDPNEDRLTYKSAAELDVDGTWDLLIGDTLAPPLDPLMLQSVAPRNGIHPITGETIAGPEAWPITNSINGHDRTIRNSDDLQYACTFPLPALRDCTQVMGACDCSDPVKGKSADNPMCQDPNTGEYLTLQHHGKAYPGQRHVRLARALGDNAVLSSICARNTQDSTRADYAYRPTVAALVTRIAPILQQPE